MLAPVVFGLSCTACNGSDIRLAGLREKHQQYVKVKELLAEKCLSAIEMPDARFFIFGMGHRTKYLFKDGTLTEIFSGDTVGSWRAQTVYILPSDYTVYLKTADNWEIFIQEDETGVWLEENGSRTVLSEGPVTLPEFEGEAYGPVLKVLHQEILINILSSGPVPNLFVYGRPWYRDAAMMCMCLKLTGNLDLVREWILGLSALYDRNNAGDCEPDNLGQALYLLSLVADSSHPLVPRILAEAEVNARSGYITGRTDGSQHPVYQTAWLRYGLAALGLPDPYVLPDTTDSYATLFWMDYKPAVPVASEASKPNAKYPYLGWAEAHYRGDMGGCIINNLDYPLTWESHASQADYRGMTQISKQFVEDKICLPHTWHAAEMFLYLIEL